jgi:hypothetical protein
MANSGYKNWLTLKKYVNGVATTETKSNTSGDSDYIAPVLDETACPTTSNNCPTFDTPISNISVNAGSVAQTIDLNNSFNDLDGDTLTYTATSSNENAVTTSISSNILTLTFSSDTGGSSTITVTGSDGTCSDEGSFTVTVSEVSTICVTGLYSLIGVFKGDTADEACTATLSNATFLIFGNGTSLTNSTNFYTTIDGCNTHPAGFLAVAVPVGGDTLTNWVQLDSTGTKIDSGLCDVSQTPAPEPTQYTSLIKCTDNTQNYYTTEIISSGISYYSNGVCYLTGSPIYDSAISGKTLVSGQQYAPNSNGPCDCDCYDQNCAGFFNLRLCSTGQLANQQIAYDDNLDIGEVILAGNGFCYEIDSFQANGLATQIVVSDGFSNCQECVDGQV